jgi:putative mRNA 3-end processing factor
VGVTNVAPSGKREIRTFVYRAGVRVAGTIVACDASAGSDLIFLSHAGALDARAARALPRARHGRRQILTTETTLALLGAPGARLRAHALLAGLGRPFALGELRLELFASGHAPGAASLLCEIGAGAAAPARRVVYAGVIGAGDTPAVRPADALCLDATFGAPRFAFPPASEALADVRGLVEGALAGSRAPLVLVEPSASAVAVATTLAEAGVALRGARAIVQIAAAHARAGLPAPPVQRWDGKLRRGEALLWPAPARGAKQLGRLESPTTILVSGRAREPGELASARADHGVPLSDRADFAGLLRYVEATGAREVALLRAPGDELAGALRARGVDVYALGPPRQIALFTGGPDTPAHVVSAV